MNPFIIKGYLSPKYFCDREKETTRIQGAINNQRNLTLVSLRKMGKTGLIFNVFNELKLGNTHETLYLDIYHTENLQGFINQLGTAIFRMRKSFEAKLKEFLHNFRRIRPLVTVDPMTGNPSLSFTITSEEDARQTLEDLFAIIQYRSQKMPVVVAIDEFQQINNYPEKNTEALIRGLIQNMHNVCFIFSGSNRTVLAGMFTDAKRPFYQSTEMMFLDEIPFDEYKHFIKATFGKNNKDIQDKVVEKILQWTRSHTFYVQYLCNKLFEQGTRSIDETMFYEVSGDILENNNTFYYEYRNLLTTHQWQLLKAIAKEKYIENITSSSFIKKHNLTNPSTVRRGVQSLMEKEMICLIKYGYYVYDPYFSRWLEMQE
ncbi:MAG: ATP-binding protein [Bacteroidales bacterium]|nr:ATP-binding protein [Bacteroidales bacterium]